MASFPHRAITFTHVTAPPLTVSTAGSVQTELNFQIGPKMIPDFGVVFLYSGTGWVVQVGRHHTLRGGELFLIFPNVTYAFAATTVAWQVYYLHFSSPGMVALLRRSGVTSREYLTRDCDRDEVRRWCEEVVREGQRKVGPDAAVVSARIWQILAALASSRALGKPPASSALKPALDYLEAHLTSEVPVATLAKLAHLSRFHFMRRFKRETGLSPRQYQINRRMTAARDLLSKGESAKSVAQQLGFNDLFYFSRLFKQKNGVPPSKYAKVGSVVES